jgi:polysaccharide export outer membrane protein
MNYIINLALLSVMLIGAGTFVTGCRTQRQDAIEHDLDVLTGQANDRAPMPASLGTARLRPGLVINVGVLVAGKKEIEAAGKRVTDKGTLVMPLLGSVPVRDLTLDELGQQLTTAYKEYFINPQVIVEFVRDDNKEGLSPWGSVTVLGRVKKPGKVGIPATCDLTLSAAIQQAGGFDTSAKETAIRITHRLPDGKLYAREVNLHSVGAQGLVEEDVMLEPDDVVYVPELVF